MFSRPTYVCLHSDKISFILRENECYLEDKRVATLTFAPRWCNTNILNVKKRKTLILSVNTPLNGVVPILLGKKDG